MSIKKIITPIFDSKNRRDMQLYIQKIKKKSKITLEMENYQTEVSNGESNAVEINLPKFTTSTEILLDTT